MLHEHAHTILPTRSTQRQNANRLAWALGITLAFVFIEAAAGWLANSLALLSDAGHNLTDAIALALSLAAVWIASRPANNRRTYGYHRAGILVALVNASTLAVMALWIFYEAWQRFFDPPEVNVTILVSVGLLAIAVNAGTAWLIHRGSKDDLNMRSAFIHLMGDVFSTAGAVVAGIMIAFTGWNWLDPLVSVFIGALILWNALVILRQTVSILLESSPRELSLPALAADLRGLPGVHGVHDLHVWSITLSLRMLSAHLVVDDIAISAGGSIQRQARELLAEKYNIHHATLQLECAACGADEMFCELNEG